MRPKAFDLVAPGAFSVYKHRGEDRRKKPMAEERPILGSLHHSHNSFDRKEQRARGVIISSYTTFAARHGPALQRKYRTDTNKAMPESDLGKLDHMLDPLWVGSLDGCFISIVVNNDCHAIKHELTDVSIAVSWLDATDCVTVSTTKASERAHHSRTSEFLLLGDSCWKVLGRAKQLRHYR